MEMLAFLTLDITWLLSFIIQNSWEACNQGTGLYYSELSERRGHGEDSILKVINGGNVILNTHVFIQEVFSVKLFIKKLSTMSKSISKSVTERK